MIRRIKYNKKLLEEICIRDDCIIDFDKIERYNHTIDIEFMCNCGNNYSKIFSNMYISGAFCKECTSEKEDIAKLQ